MNFKRIKLVGTSKTLIEEQGKYTKNGFRAAVSGKSHVGNTKTFDIIRDTELNLDEEHRLHTSRFEKSEIVFDCEKITVMNCRIVHLTDCIFLGSIRLNFTEPEECTLKLDNCVILGDLSIDGPASHFKDFTFHAVRGNEIAVRAISFDDFSITDSMFQSVRLSSIQGTDLRFVGNYFGSFAISEATIDRVYFLPGQIATHKAKARLEKFLADIGFGLQCPLRNREMPNFCGRFHKRAINEKRANELETIDFLSNRTAERNSRRDLARLKYRRAMIEASFFGKIFIFATGAFVRPVYFLFWSALTIFSFAFTYLHWLSDCFSGNVVNIREALYFSGITFSTIGYGDILPLGYARCAAVGEGLLGVLLASCFVVSLVRRHVE